MLICNEIKNYWQIIRNVLSLMLNDNIFNYLIGVQSKNIQMMNLTSMNIDQFYMFYNKITWLHYNNDLKYTTIP